MKPSKLEIALGRGVPRSSFGIASALVFGLGLSVSSVFPQTVTREPDFEDYAPIEAYVDGTPVYSLGNIAYIYGLSPDLLPGAMMQQGNNNPVIKIKPKKSWEIKSNGFGVTIGEPGVRSMRNDSQPMLPIHLIDGDSDTAWCSYGSAVPDARPEWIRIDLPRESKVASVALVCSADFALAKLWREGKLTDLMGYHEWAGRALPNELKIQVSRDAWHWTTVYDNKNFSGNEEGTTSIEFEPVLAKQILISGRNFKRTLSKYDGYAFSLGELEVRDRQGDNLALISRGSGVTVSSTSHLMNHDRFTQEFLFGPVQYDLGLKYVRMGADNGLLTWNYVEREKGKLQVDPVADALVTEMHGNGINIVINVDVKANFIYKGRKLDWKKARIREINNIYYDHPGWAWETPEMMEGYLRYVDYMVGHFKDRVSYWEIGNEWADERVRERRISSRDVYAMAVRRIKKVDPDARIMVGVHWMADFPRLLRDWLDNLSKQELDLLMPEAVGSHPTTRIDAGLTLNDLRDWYWDQNRQAIKEGNALGFKGTYMASEVYSWSLYPPGPSAVAEGDPKVSSYYLFGKTNGESEMVRAKYLAQNMVGHTGLNMLAFQCNTYFVGAPVGQSLFRVPVPAQTIHAVQPDAGYYTLRTLATVLDEWTGSEFPVSFSGDKGFEVFTLQRGESELMVAAWLPGDTTDGLVESKSDVTLPMPDVERAWVVDVLNGTEQELTFSNEGQRTVFEGMLIKDYPTLIRVKRWLP